MPGASVTSRRPPPRADRTAPLPAGTRVPEPDTSASWLPLAAWGLLLAGLLLSLRIADGLRGEVEKQLGSRLAVAAELVAGAMTEVEVRPGEALDGAVLGRLEDARRATSISEIWLYDADGRLLGGTTGDATGAGVPSRLRLGEGVGLREAERDAAGGLTLVHSLPRTHAVGAVLARLDRDSQGALPVTNLLFLAAKALTALLVVAGALVVLRRLSRGSQAPVSSAPPSEPGAGDVGVVLGTVTEVMSSYRDRWTAAEADAERWRQTSDLILESITSGIVAFRPDGKITLFNRAAQEILGVPAGRARGRTVEEAFGEGDEIARLATELRLTGRPSSRVEVQRSSPEGDPRWLGVSTSVLRGERGQGAGGILLLSDLTETKHLQEQMERKDRLSAVGEMSAGIAHEIKNSLHSLMGFANLLREDFPTEEPMAVRGILTEVESLEAMVKSVLELSRPSSLVLAPGSVNDLARDVHSALESRARGEAVAFHLDLEEPLPRVLLDADALRRALLNLALNAVEAMAGGGTLTISTRRAENRGVRVALRDTGPGIPDADRARIFTPFYTTKRGGSGLGLALAHRTITDHGGRLHLHSRVGVGTELVVQLPPEAS